MTRFRLAVGAVCVAALAVAAVGTASQTKTTKTTRTRRSRGTSRSSGSGPARSRSGSRRSSTASRSCIRTSSVKYTSGGDNTPTILSTAIQGGKPPDLASIGQPGLLRDFANQGASSRSPSPARPPRRTTPPTGSSSARSRASSTASSSRGRTSRPSGTRRPRSRPPASSRRRPGPHLLAAANTLQGVGHARVLDRRRRRVDAHRPVREHLHPPGGAGQLRQADRAHDPGTHPTVKAALTDDGDRCFSLGQHVRRHSGALQTDFPTSVNNVWGEAAQGGDGPRSRLRPRASRRPQATAITDYNVFKFPSIGGSPPSVVGGGDIVVMFKDSPATRALVTYLARRRRRRSRPSTRPATRPRTRTSLPARTPTR